MHKQLQKLNNNPFPPHLFPVPVKHPTDNRHFAKKKNKPKTSSLERPKSSLGIYVSHFFLFLYFPSFSLLPRFSIWFWFFFPLPYLLFSIPTDTYLFPLAPLSEWWKNSSKVLLFCWECQWEYNGSVFSHCNIRSVPDDLNTFSHAARWY